MTSKQPAVYILANRRNGTLYTGVTGNLPSVCGNTRTTQSKGSRRNTVSTRWFMSNCTTRASAINREKQIKNWKRKWKVKLIEKQNPTWRDLYEELV